MHAFQVINDDGIKGIIYNTITDENNAIGNTKPITSTRMSFDDAVGLIKFGKFHYFLIFVAGLNLTSILSELSSISYVLPVLQCDFKLTTTEKGILTAIGYAGNISCSYLFGFLSDTLGRRKVMLPSLFLTVICSILSSFTNNFTIFLILRFLNGLFTASSSSTIMVYLSEFHNTKTRSRNILFSSVINGLTCMLIPITAYLVINEEWHIYIPIINVTYKSWRLFLIVASLPSLVCALAFIYLPESPKYMLSKGYETEAIRIMQFTHRINNGADVAPPVIESIFDQMDSEFKINNLNDIRNDNKDLLAIFKKFWRQTIPIFMHPYVRCTFFICSINFILHISGNGIYSWIPEILNRISEYLNSNVNRNISICHIMYEKGLNLTAVLEKNELNKTLDCNFKLEFETIQYTFIMEIIYTIGSGVIGLIVNCIGKIMILSTISVVCGACGILLTVLKIPLLGIYFSIILCSSRIAIIVLSATTIELFPTNIRASANCLSLMMGRVGAVVGANMAGLLLDNYCEYLFSVIGFMLIVSAVLAFCIPKVQQNKT